MNSCFLCFLMILSVNLNAMDKEGICDFLNTPHNMTEALDKLQTTMVKLPSAEVLKERIISIPRFSDGDFLAKYKVDLLLGNKECNLVVIALFLKEKLFRHHNFFNTCFQDDLTFELIKTEKTVLCKKILQEYPDAIKTLQDTGIIEDWL